MMMVVEVEDLVIRGGEGKRRRFAEGEGDATVGRDMHCFRRSSLGTRRESIEDLGP